MNEKKSLTTSSRYKMPFDKRRKESRHFAYRKSVPQLEKGLQNVCWMDTHGKSPVSYRPQMRALRDELLRRGHKSAAAAVDNAIECVKLAIDSEFEELEAQEFVAELKPVMDNFLQAIGEACEHSHAVLWMAPDWPSALAPAMTFENGEAIELHPYHSDNGTANPV